MPVVSCCSWLLLTMCRRRHWRTVQNHAGQLPTEKQHVGQLWDSLRRHEEEPQQICQFNQDRWRHLWQSAWVVFTIILPSFTLFSFNGMCCWHHGRYKMFKSELHYLTHSIVVTYKCYMYVRIYKWVSLHVFTSCMYVHTTWVHTHIYMCVSLHVFTRHSA